MFSALQYFPKNERMKECSAKSGESYNAVKGRTLLSVWLDIHNYEKIAAHFDGIEDLIV